MSEQLLNLSPEVLNPEYNIYHFIDGIFKVVHFKSTAPVFVSGDKKQRKGNEFKLDPAISRARRSVLELGLCNDWKYFVTFTFDKEKHDRFNLDLLHKTFNQWVRDQRKKYPEISFRFVLVPEPHDKGGWHFHGLFSDISPLLVSFRELWDRGENVPWKLVENGYFTWPALQEKFGFCSFGIIRDKVATGFYITKYVTKSLNNGLVGVGKHLYWPSKPLRRPQKHGEIYGHCGYLDKFLVNHYDFCSTGMTHVKDGLSWDFAMEYMLIEPFETQGTPDQAELLEVDTYYEAVQEVLEGF